MRHLKMTKVAPNIFVRYYEDEWGNDFLEVLVNARVVAICNEVEDVVAFLWRDYELDPDKTHPRIREIYHL